MQTNSNIDTEIRRDCQVSSQPLLHRDPEDERKRTSKQDLTLWLFPEKVGWKRKGKSEKCRFRFKIMSMSFPSVIAKSLIPDCNNSNILYQARQRFAGRVNGSMHWLTQGFFQFLGVVEKKGSGSKLEIICIQQTIPAERNELPGFPLQPLCSIGRLQTGFPQLCPCQCHLWVRSLITVLGPEFSGEFFFLGEGKRDQPCDESSATHLFSQASGFSLFYRNREKLQVEENAVHALTP